MAADEIAYNSYFHLLQEKYRAKYEQARDHNWLICIPTSQALRGVHIDDRFVELHTLQLLSNSTSASGGRYCSTDEQRSLEFCLHGATLVLQASQEPYIVTVLSEEVGYNTRFQPYKLLIVDKLLSPDLQPEIPHSETWLDLNHKISSLSQAQEFLNQHREFAPQLSRSVTDLLSQLQHFAGVEAMCDLVRHAVRAQWQTLLTTQPLHLQRDARFQLLLSTALENHVVSGVHQEVFQSLCAHFREQDLEVHNQALSLLGVSPDQLGAPEDLAVQLPAAVVELAALDTLACPIEKLTCLRTCLDLIFAQVKGALVDFHAFSCTNDEWVPQISSDALLPLLMAVIVHAKPLHLISNLFYIEHLQWTLAPNDALSYSLVTFKAALQQLRTVKPEQLRPRSKKVLRELALQDLILVAGEMEQPDRKVTSPLDRELETITAMIEASTREISS